MSDTEQAQLSTSAFQNRLVGTVILVALAVIFLPDILDGEKQTHQDSFVSIPKRPEFQPVPEAKTFDQTAIAERVEHDKPIENEVALDDPVESDTDIAVTTAPEDVEPSENNSVVPAAVDAETNKSGDFAIEDKDVAVSAGWVVQLGSFRNQKNVNELIAKLQDSGYRVFSKKVATQSGELTKVLVGPEVNKEKLEKSLPELNKLTKLTGKIVQFNPV